MNVRDRFRNFLISMIAYFVLERPCGSLAVRMKIGAGKRFELSFFPAIMQ